jgi:hypothetical protein
MIPNNFYFGGGSVETVMTPAGALLLLLASICILALPRKYVLIPVILGAFFVPRGLVLVISGFHISPVRLIAFVGWIRLAYMKWIAGSELIGKRWNSVDGAFLWCELFSACAFVLLWRQQAAVFNQIGYLWETLGMYFLLRILIQDKSDVLTAIKVLGLVAIVNAGEMVYEQKSFQNLFGVYLGGVDAVPMLRDDKIRSQGAFGYSILAGTYAATLVPLLVLLWERGKSRILAAAGVLACVVMVYTCASSTPALAIVAGILGLALWPFRRSMRLIRWGIVAFLVLAHITMKAPVWFLIAHMDVMGASSGYHRAELVDVFIRHFWDWWLVGTKDTGNWGWDMFDLSNNYVARGESGGIITFVLFVAVISRSFGRLGRARKAVAGSLRREWFFWALGAALFAHVVGFFGISYWDQTAVAWYALLAMISAATAGELASAEKVEPQLGLTDAGILEPASVPERWELSQEWGPSNESSL